MGSAPPAARFPAAARPAPERERAHGRIAHIPRVERIERATAGAEVAQSHVAALFPGAQPVNWERSQSIVSPHRKKDHALS